MARTQKDIVNYFPHDANACSGDTLSVLQSRFGNDGYAFWFKLLEKLSTTEGHCLDCRNAVKWQLLLAKTGVDEITGVEIMKILVEMQAIDKDLWESKLIWCQNLVDNLTDVYKNRRREIPQKPINTGSKPISTGDNSLTTDQSTQSKVKESKVNKSILLARFDQFWEVYPKKIAKGFARKAFAKINPDEELLATMIAKLLQAKETHGWKKEDGKYIPNPTSWLNAEGWEDEYGEGQQPTTGRGPGRYGVGAASRRT